MIHRRRRLLQWISLLAFLGLLTATVWPLGRLFLGAFLVADPLIAANTIASGVVMWEMLLAAGVLVSALLLGRVFCGYVCPLGLLVEMTSPSTDVRPARGGDAHREQARQEVRDRRTEGFRRLPLLVLAACLGPLLFGSGIYLLLDPLSLLTRTVTTLAFPLIDQAIRLSGDLAYLAPPLRGPVDAANALLSGRLVHADPLTYDLQVMTLAVFLGLLALSAVRARFWCRYLCPLGALLGLAGRVAPFGRVVDAEACTGCMKCSSVCPMDAVRDGGLGTDMTRCQLGLECADACPEGAIGFGRVRKRHVHDPTRRALIRTAGASVAAGFFLYMGTARSWPGDSLVRPPGSGEEARLLGLCSRCGQCIKVCPTNVLQPAVFEAGLEGFYTPRLGFDRGYCDWSCNECGKVCPTRAIEPLTLEEKRVEVIGRAYIDHDRCLPWADGVGCIVCQELCPTPDKAIVLEESEVTAPEGGRSTLLLPVVVPELCIGCGVCQFHCPVERDAAIRVSGGLHVRSTLASG